MTALHDARSRGWTPRTYTIALPSGLSLININYRRAHVAWRAKKIRTAAAEACYADATMRWALIAADPNPLLDRVHVLGVLHPTNDLNPYDPINWAHSFKAATDGLVDAGVVADDNHLHVLGPDMRLGPVVDGGQLVLHLRELAPGEDPLGYEAVTLP